MTRRRQSGIALVTAILVVALATIAATAILTSANIAIHRSANLQDSEKAWWYATGAESFMKSVLERDLDDNKIDSLDDAWAKPIDYLPVDEGFLRGSMVDLQGRFNLNNLGNPNEEKRAKFQDQFAKLMQNLEAGDGFQAKAIAAAIRDWVDKDSEPSGFDGAEDAEYLGMNPAQRVPNRPMESVTELLAIKGMTREIFGKLRDHVAALPLTETAINVNTATPALMRALVKQSSPEFERFIEERKEKPAETIEELTTRGVIVAGDNESNLLTTSSNYFLLRVEAVIGAGRVSLYSRYYRPAQGVPVVLGHSIDTD